MSEGCKQCEDMLRERGPGPYWLEERTVCKVCNKEVDKVLDLHHTRARLCSLDCEISYWLDLVF